ncbi:class I SAM-dependent methyltransferase [Actinocrispum sp. NPDC049592]|uniref:class I SAM-dependent methyltransferase n=1 Tax=Actinocrispum sp. NPDC049592 TaxID=3154835 RepID=UPI00343856F2
MTRERLRRTFNEDAQLYDRYRPEYPLALFGELPAGPGTRVLEIGCGTGQATAPVARLGCSVVAVELGAELAAVARHKLASMDVEVIVSAFEDWPLPVEKFDLVMAATAFHWLDPEIRMDKCANALRPGGTLAVISTEHILGGTEQFFAEVQDIYERWDPATPPGLRLQPAAEIPREFDVSDRFGEVRFHRYEWDELYSTEDYLGVLSTYSGHRALPTRENLLADIAALIDTRYNGRITKRYMAQLAIARKLP